MRIWFYGRRYRPTRIYTTVKTEDMIMKGHSTGVDRTFAAACTLLLPQMVFIVRCVRTLNHPHPPRPIKTSFSPSGGCTYNLPPKLSSKNSELSPRGAAAPWLRLSVINCASWEFETYTIGLYKYTWLFQGKHQGQVGASRIPLRAKICIAVKPKLNIWITHEKYRTQ